MGAAGNKDLLINVKFKIDDSALRAVQDSVRQTQDAINQILSTSGNLASQMAQAHSTIAAAATTSTTAHKGLETAITAATTQLGNLRNVGSQAHDAIAQSALRAASAVGSLTQNLRQTQQAMADIAARPMSVQIPGGSMSGGQYLVGNTAYQLPPAGIPPPAAPYIRQLPSSGAVYGNPNAVSLYDPRMAAASGQAGQAAYWGARGGYTMPSPQGTWGAMPQGPQTQAFPGYPDMAGGWNTSWAPYRGVQPYIPRINYAPYNPDAGAGLGGQSSIYQNPQGYWYNGTYGGYSGQYMRAGMMPTSVAGAGPGMPGAPYGAFVGSSGGATMAGTPLAGLVAGMAALPGGGGILGSILSGYAGSAFGGVGAGGGMGALGGAVSGAAGGLGISAASLPLLAYSAGNAVLGAYNTGQDYLQTISRTKKETGVGAQEASDARAMLSFTQMADSPFATITLAQVHAGLQNVDDFRKGLVAATPQVEQFDRALRELKIEPLDEKGEIKTMTNFILELSKSVEGLPGARKAQLAQSIGGLFGKDFAAMFETDYDTLKKRQEASVMVSEQMLKLSDARKGAIENAVSAERQFEIAATKGLAPIDMQLQRLKQIALLALSGAVLPDADANVLRQKVLPGDNKTQTQLTGLGAVLTAVNPLLGIIKGFNSTEFQGSQGGTVEGVDVVMDAVRKRKAAELEAEGKEKDIKVVASAKMEAARQAQADQLAAQVERASKDALKEAVNSYRLSLTQLSREIDLGGAAEGRRMALNDMAIASFDAVMDKVTSASRVYDNYYKNLRDTQEKIDLLKKKGEGGTIVTTNNGTAIKGDVNDILKLQADMQLDALREKKGVLTDRTAGGAVNLTKDPAQRQQKLEALLLSREITQLTQGKADLSLAERAEKLGFKPGEAITTTGVKASFVARQLSPADVEQQTNLYERLKELNIQDKENQFNTMREGVEKYLKSLKPTVEEQDDFNLATKAMGKGLTEIAEKSGLFESIGFSRAIAEASLQAKLAGGEFGTGADGVTKFYEASRKMYGVLDEYKDFLTGYTPITEEAAAKIAPRISDESAGLNQIGVKTQGYKDQLAERDAFMKKAKEGKLTTMDISSALYESIGLDTSKGVGNVFDMTVKVNTDEAAKEADKVKKIWDDVFAKGYNMNITFSGMTIEEMKAALQNIRDITGIPGYKPPSYMSPTDLSKLDPMLGVPVGDATGKSIRPWYESLGFSANIGDLIPQIKPTITPQSITDVELDFTNLIDGLTKQGKTNPAEATAKLADGTKDYMFNAYWSEIFVPLQAQMLKNPLIQKVIIVQEGSGGAGATEPPPHGPAGWSPPPPPKEPPPDIKAPLAEGGYMNRGRGRLVGEEGMEFFMPESNGYLMNAASTRRLIDALATRPVVTGTSGTSPNINNYLSIDARGSQSPSAVEQAVRRAAQATFMSDDYQYRQRDAMSRRGIK